MLRWLGLLAWLICLAPSGHAGGSASAAVLSVQSLGEGRQHLAVDHVVEDHGPLTLEQAMALPDSAWKRARWTSASYGFSAAPHWFRITPMDVEPGLQEILLEVAYPLLDQVELHVRTAAYGPWQIWLLGDKQPFGQRPILARNFVVPVAVQPGDRLEVVARVSTSGSMRYPLVAWERQALENAEHGFLLTNGIYIGLMAGIFFYHLIIFLIVREPIYLYYAGWIVFTTGFILSYNGLAAQYLWPQATAWNDWSRAIFLLLSSGFFTSFTIQFLQGGGAGRWGPRPHGWPVALAAVVASASVLLSFSNAARLALGVQLFSVALCFGLATVKAWRGHLLARIFLVAFSGVMVGAVLLAMDMLGFTRYVEHLVSLERVPQGGSALAVVLFALALANRLLEERRHRFHAAEMQRMNEALAASMRVEQDRSHSLLQLKDRLRLEAERRDKDKSRFLADAVHDLRQPLQAIGNALDPISHAIRSGHTANALSLVGMATRAAANMRSQLSEILNLSRLESGLVEAELSDFDVALLIAETVEQTRGGALASSTAIEFDAPIGRPVFVRSDRHFVQRILLNLISNGIKYRSTVQGRASHVRLALSEDGACARIAVHDNGIGIAQDILQGELIFRPFFQINNRHAEAEKGVGLGLSIVAAMLRLLPDHHMSIGSTVGVGSTFTLQVPVSPVAPVLGAIALDDFAAASVDAAVGKYVVLLEDDVLVRETLAAVFGAHGVLYEAWGSLQEMHEQLPQTERAPDVLLSDYRLPDGRTALDAMRLMRAHWSDVPTIILTGETLDSATAQQLHGASICYKPIAPLDLLRRIGASAARKAAPSNFGLL